MTTLFAHQKQEENFRDILSKHISKKSEILNITGNGNTFGAYIISQLHSLSENIVVVVTNTQEDAERYVDELKFFTDNNSLRQVIYFPSYDISPLKQVYNQNEILAKRVACLYHLLQNNSKLTIVTDLIGLKQKVIPIETLIKYFDLVKLEQKIDPESFINKLISGGYNYTFIVEERGDLSVRSKNQIIDIFPPIYNDPIRIELSNNVIKSIRFFSSINQITIKNISEFVLLPTCETVFESDKMNSIISKIRTFGIEYNFSCNYIDKIIKDIKKKHKIPMIEGNTAPMIYDHMDSLFNYIPESSIIVTVNRSKLLENDIILENHANTIFDEAIKNKKLCAKPEDLFFTYASLEKDILSRNLINYKTYETFWDSDCSVKKYHFKAIVKNYKNNKKLSPSSLLIKILLKNKVNGYLTIIICTSENQIKKIISILSSENLKFNIGKKFINNNEENDSSIWICIGKIKSGFNFPTEHISFIVYQEIFTIKESANIKKIQNNVSNLNLMDIGNLKNGEYVVLTEHGIGQYNGLIKLNVGGTVSDFLLIIYKDNDKLYLPVDRMELIHKYMSYKEEYIPCLDKIGGKSWEKLKNKARSSAKKITESLLKIYAKREIQEGYSFSCKNEELIEFGSLFKHEETPDQLKAINDVVTDMKKKTPMDRLICGDVGYGKTEIALRASFIATKEKKQVAILVPTTILAEQHFITFSNRFKKYPVNIACLSRFKSKKDQANIIENIKKGFVDIVIGTHRLLQCDVSFINLGLLILDEEQRFGVEHKEKIKQIKTSIDVLALTATPIPRTLYLSLLGIRDISVMSTPPSYRRPIITQICEFDYELVAIVIKKELNRKGQIFFIHNNVKTIQFVAQRIKTYIPEVKLGVAHGQMDECRLEAVMVDFIKNKIDMIVCTTIIESGIDIAKANTIIINRADKLGLAQIYQIRGRVGRSNKQAYAYLFVPNKNFISTRASRRLKVIMDHNKLGSGFQVAMNDMKIRGGGSILGASQAGHISAVGYEMFLKLIEKSISKIKGESKQDLPSTEVNIPMPTFIPEDYISTVDHRFTIYHKLAGIKQLEDLSNFKKELIDRFGKMPEETKNLFLKIVLKILGSRAFIKKIDLRGYNLTLFFDKKHKINLPKIKNMITSNNNNYYEFEGYDVLNIKLKYNNKLECLVQIKKLLIEIKHHVSSC